MKTEGIDRFVMSRHGFAKIVEEGARRFQAHYFDECSRLYKRVLVEADADGHINVPPAEKPGHVKLVPTAI